MKAIKIILFSLAMGAGISQANAGDEHPIAIKQLPIKIQEFIQTHFKLSDVSFTKVDREFLDVNYEVFFTDGSKAEFNKKGDWTEVDCRQNVVPARIIPDNILNYISNRHGELSVIKIDRDCRDYEIKLNNGLEMIFDNKGKFLRYDD